MFTDLPAFKPEQEIRSYASALGHADGCGSKFQSMLFFAHPVVDIETVTEQGDKELSFVYAIEKQVSDCASKLIVPEVPILNSVEILDAAQALNAEDDTSTFIAKAVVIFDLHKISQVNLPNISNSNMFNEDGVYIGANAKEIFKDAIAMDPLKRELRDEYYEEFTRYISENDPRYLVVKEFSDPTKKPVIVSEPGILLSMLDAEKFVVEYQKNNPTTPLLILPRLSFNKELVDAYRKRDLF